MHRKPIGARRRIIKAPIPKATMRARSKAARCSVTSPAPSACATRPAVPMRRKPKLQNKKLKIIAAAAIAARRCACPSLPMIAASATPRSGVDKFASVMGRASRATLAWLTRGGFTMACVSEEVSGSAAIAHIHEPQHQPYGHDDHGAGKNIICDFANCSETEAPYAVDDFQNPAKYVLWLYVEPHEECA